MYRRSLFSILGPIVLGGMCLVWAGCGSDSESTSHYAPIELRELVPADDSTFDVDWKPETIVADEADVLSALDNLQPHDGVFRIQATSPLLQDLSVGSIVVWPQVGIFEIVDIRSEDHLVEVETKWATFGDAASGAECKSCCTSSAAP